MCGLRRDIAPRLQLTQAAVGAQQPALKRRDGILGLNAPRRVETEPLPQRRVFDQPHETLRERMRLRLAQHRAVIIEDLTV